MLLFLIVYGVDNEGKVDQRFDIFALPFVPKGAVTNILFCENKLARPDSWFFDIRPQDERTIVLFVGGMRSAVVQCTRRHL
jgi:hypothetical protein